MILSRCGTVFVRVTIKTCCNTCSPVCVCLLSDIDLLSVLACFLSALSFPVTTPLFSRQNDDEQKCGRLEE